MTRARSNTSLDERALTEAAKAPAGAQEMERVMNPDGLRIVGDHLVARCKACDGVGMHGAFYCGNCNGAGVVEVRRG